MAISLSWIFALVHISFKKRDVSAGRYTLKVGQRKGDFINSINGGEEKMYTADQVCSMIDF